MKSVKNFAIFVFLFIFATACNKSSEEVLPENQKITNSQKSATTTTIELSNEASNFIKNFYSSDYVLGQQIETSDDNVTYLVSEIIVNNETRARGYITTDVRGENPTYFVDVDRSNYQLHNVDIVNNKTTIINEIDKIDDYYETNEFDVIALVDDNNATKRRPFIGSREECTNCVMGVKHCSRVGYFFWIETTRSKPVGKYCGQ
jgi:hypothetical protein